MAPTMKRRVLIVTHDESLLATRILLVEHAGYTAIATVSDDNAIKLLETEVFDLILLGRDSSVPPLNLDQRVHEIYPNLLTLKIQPDGDLTSVHPWRITDSVPQHVIDTLKQMLITEH